MRYARHLPILKSQKYETFRDICKQCDGMQIVATLNQMFGMFDVLSDKNNIYKVGKISISGAKKEQHPQGGDGQGLLRRRGWSP